MLIQDDLRLLGTGGSQMEIVAIETGTGHMAAPDCNSGSSVSAWCLVSRAKTQ